MSDNRLNKPSEFRGRFSELKTEPKKRKKPNKKAFERQRMKVLSYLKHSYPDETMMEFLKRKKNE